MDFSAGQIGRKERNLAADERVRTAFFSALIFGLAAHGMGLANKYSFHDDIHALFEIGATVSYGRWMLEILGKLEVWLFGDGHYSLPLFNGLFSILCAAAAAGILVKDLKIRNRFFCAGAGALLAAFPAVTSLFGYMYTAPYYMLAMLMMVHSARLICLDGKWWRKLAGALLAGCAAGIYQAYLPVLLSVIVLENLALLEEREEKSTKTLTRIGVCAVCIAAAMVFYFGMNRFFLNISNQQLTTYQGIAGMENTPLSEYLQRVSRAYREFFFPARNVAWDMYPQHMHWVYQGMVAADILLSLMLVIRLTRKNRVRAVLTAAMLLLFPLGSNLIFVMAEDPHALMMYGQAMQFLLLLFLMQHTEISGPMLRRIVFAGAAVLVSLSCVMYARFDNQCYLKAEFEQQQAVSYYTTLITRIRSTPGYRDDFPVAYINENHIEDENLYNIDELNLTFIAPYNADIRDYVNSYSWRRFMGRWCGFLPEEVKETKGLEQMPQIQAMPRYPDDGSILVLENQVIVKF